MKVSYNGTALNQAGQMSSCVVFDPPYVCGNTGNATFTGTHPNMDRYSGDFSYVKNGLWKQTTNITGDSHGLEALYMPIDTGDYQFARAGHMRASGQANSAVFPSATSTTTFFISSGDTFGTMVFVGQNLPANTSCIYVDIYNMYEVVPDPTGLPIIKVETSSHEDHSSTFKKVADNIKPIRVSNGETKSVVDSFADSIGEIASSGLGRIGISMLGNLLSF
jgi:hypothetical protein